MRKNNVIGIVAKVELLTGFSNPLLSFTLTLSYHKINCLVANKAACIPHYQGTQVAIFGHYYNRNQPIIEKLVISKLAFISYDLVKEYRL